jgi:hypothetical protein
MGKCGSTEVLADDEKETKAVAQSAPDVKAAWSEDEFAEAADAFIKVDPTDKRNMYVSKAVNSAVDSFRIAGGKGLLEIEIPQEVDKLEGAQAKLVNHLLTRELGDNANNVKVNIHCTPSQADGGFRSLVMSGEKFDVSVSGSLDRDVGSRDGSVCFRKAPVSSPSNIDAMENLVSSLNANGQGSPNASINANAKALRSLVLPLKVPGGNEM